MKKVAVKVLLIFIVSLAGLFLIATGFLPSARSENIIASGTPQNISDDFYRYEHLLLNAPGNPVNADSIKLLNSRFEQNYLLALKEKRRGDFKNSFELLYPLLKDKPEYYPYYDELVTAAKAAGAIDTLKNIGTLPAGYADYLKALVCYHKSEYLDGIEIIKGKDDFEQLYLFSYLYRGTGDYDSALTVMKKAEELAGKGSYELSRIYVSLGSLYLLSGNYSEAEEYYKKGLSTAQAANDKREEIKAYINLAILDDTDGEVYEAQEKLMTALRLSREIKNMELEAASLSELAVSFTYSGNVVEAKNNYEKSYWLSKKLNHRERLSNLCANIASLYTASGNYLSALSYYNEGLSHAGENINSQILNLRGLGDVYSNLSNYSKALSYYEKAKDLSGRIKNPSAAASADLSIGTLYYNVNNPEKALRIFSGLEGSDPYIQEEIYFKTGLAYYALDSLDKSTASFLSALDIARSLEDSYYKTIILTELSNNYIRSGDIKKAENSLSEAMKEGFKQALGVQYLYMGKIFTSKNNAAAAAEYFKKASESALEVMDYNNAVEAYYLLARLYNDAKNFTDAEKNYLKAVELSDKISEMLTNNAEVQISHFSGVNNAYNELAEMYLEQSRNEEAFLIIERSRSRNTFRNLAEHKIISSGAGGDDLTRYYDLKWMIESGLYTGDQQAVMKDEIEELKRRIFQGNTAAASLRQLSLKEIQNVLAKGENIITLFFGVNNSYFIRLSKGKLSVVNTGSTPAEASLMLSRISPLYSPGYKDPELYLNQDLFSFNTREAYNFYKKIIEPGIRDIPAGEQLIFSFPAELAFVPVEFLVTEYSEGDSPFYYRNKKYLVDNYPVSYSPSASIYVLQKEEEPGTRDKVLLVGDPRISDQDFALSYRGGMLQNNYSGRNLIMFPLKYSREEIQNVNSIFDNGTVFLSGDATEKNFKENASGSSIIHLSTHSFLVEEQPLIVFSQTGDGEEDGYLEPGEIIQLKLNSDLVVLSSCRSGLGAVDRSEGVLGMQKSFFEAGAKSIVVSLWDVNDKYTSVFMQSFYKYLTDGLSKTEALRKAKIYFRKNHSANPYYWSAFILSGDISEIRDINTASGWWMYLLLPGLILSAVAVFILYRKSHLRKVQDA